MQEEVFGLDSAVDEPGAAHADACNEVSALLLHQTQPLRLRCIDMEAEPSADRWSAAQVRPRERCPVSATLPCDGHVGTPLCSMMTGARASFRVLCRCFLGAGKFCGLGPAP